MGRAVVVEPQRGTEGYSPEALFSIPFGSLAILSMASPAAAG
jgi:hypothetical protein